MSNPKLSGRKTIGVLIDWTVDPYQQILLSGIMDVAKNQGVNCIIFEGGAVGSPDEHETQRNGIYQLASGQVVYGLVVLSASIVNFIGETETKAFCENFSSHPLVSISVEIENATSVLADNRPGMRDLLVHLVEQHGFQRFGFVKGRTHNQDAGERFDVFLEVLRERQLPLLSQYMFQGDFTGSAGIEAARDFLGKGIEGIGVIVAANDNMARGVIQELERSGIRIPEQMAVTGFDDLDSGDFLFPLLSTVRQPIYE
jgi:DNA-binding LacI/PurR family transcriptional regulator